MAASHDEAVLVGFCDGAVDTKKYKSSYLTNKIGGQPDIIPNISWQYPSCQSCNTELAHVVQVYCPLEASSYHRNIHVFACTSQRCCGKLGSWRALRSQCLESKMITSSVPQSSVLTPVKETLMSTTDWCDEANDWGMEEEEQVVIGDTSQAQVITPFGHSEVATAANVDLDVSQKLQVLTLNGVEENPTPKTIIFCSFYISVMDESDLVEERDLQHAQELLKEYEEREGLAVRELGSCKDGAKEKYEKTKARHGDAVFSRFMKKISVCPEQILRYSWKGSPLFISEPPSNVSQMVPVCSLCGSSKSFEFQLMPALVSLLKSEDSNLQVTLEFGTVLVYTCRNSCWTPDSVSPVEEFVFIQADPDQQLFK